MRYGENPDNDLYKPIKQAAYKETILTLWADKDADLFRVTAQLADHNQPKDEAAQGEARDVLFKCKHRLQLPKYLSMEDEQPSFDPQAGYWHYDIQAKARSNDPQDVAQRIRDMTILFNTICTDMNNSASHGWASPDKSPAPTRTIKGR